MDVQVIHQYITKILIQGLKIAFTDNKLTTTTILFILLQNPYNAEYLI